MQQRLLVQHRNLRVARLGCDGGVVAQVVEQVAARHELGEDEVGRLPGADAEQLDKIYKKYGMKLTKMRQDWSM